jgi:hypothetical protein
LKLDEQYHYGQSRFGKTTKTAFSQQTDTIFTMGEFRRKRRIKADMSHKLVDRENIRLKRK